MEQIVAGEATTITASILDGETPVSVASVTVGIVDDLGDTVVAAASAATVSTDGPVGTVTYRLDGALIPTPQILTVTWTALDGDDVEWVKTVLVEVVGARYFTLAELRNMPDVTDRYTPEHLDLARQWIAGLVHRECRTSFVERYHSETRGRRSFDGCALSLTGTWLRHLVDIAFTATDDVSHLDDLLAVQVDTGKVTFLGPVNGSNPFLTSPRWDTTVIRYVAGYSDTPPQDLRSAMLDGARNYLIEFYGNAGVPARATSLSTENGTFGVRSAGKNRPTGYDRVDATINEWRCRTRASSRGV